MLTDSEQLEAELAAVRADTQAEVSHAAQQEAAARRERMQADEAAEPALRAADEPTSAPRPRPRRQRRGSARPRRAGARRGSRARRAGRARTAEAASRGTGRGRGLGQRSRPACRAGDRATPSRPSGNVTRRSRAPAGRARARSRPEQARHADTEQRGGRAGRQRARKDAERAEQQAPSRRAARRAGRQARAGRRRPRRPRPRSAPAPSARSWSGARRTARGRQAAELDTGRAQAALDAEQRLRGQLEKDLAGPQRRLEAAEKARDAAIASIQAAAAARHAPRQREAGAPKTANNDVSRFPGMPPSRRLYEKAAPAAFCGAASPRRDQMVVRARVLSGCMARLLTGGCVGPVRGSCSARPPTARAGAKRRRSTAAAPRGDCC